jgi:lysozyme family protein
VADFLTAYKLTATNEGGWANNPRDDGGETAFGIARHYWPEWEGWPVIDGIKRGIGPEPPYGTISHNQYAHQINTACRANTTFMSMVSDFYQKNFWGQLGGINDQELANKIYDMGVNSGTSEAAKLIQRCIGTNDDGRIGPKTLTGINAADPDALRQSYKAARIGFYKQLVAEHPSDAEFYDDWVARC